VHYTNPAAWTLAPLGVMLTDQPITPERVVRALGGSK
jgi:hypothetical protein